MIELLCAADPRDPLRSRSVVMDDRHEGSFIQRFLHANESRLALDELRA